MTRRPSGAFVLSVALHIVLGAALVWLLAMPLPFHQWFVRQPEQPIEHLSFIQVPNRGPSTPGRSGGDNTPETPKRRPRPIVAPTTTPTSIPTLPAKPAPRTPEGGAGPVVGAGGVEVGIMPSFSDPRLWLPPGPAMGAPRSQSQRLDSVIVARLQPYLDSMQAIAATQGKAPGDWTFGKGSGKWGMDPKNIYIGGHAIPTAILALLPLNKGANPITSNENKTLAFERVEILENAQRAMNEDEFREAVKRIRERKQREHDADLKDRQQKKQQSDSAVVHP
jgi:hypothetical protein